MKEINAPSKPSAIVISLILAFGAVGLSLIALGRRDYPNLHTTLDAGICLLSVVLSLLLWDVGGRTDKAFARWVAICFAVAAVAELTHVLVNIEWFGWLAPVAHAQPTLRPATWPIAAYVRPIGLGWAIGLLIHRRQRATGFAIALVVLSALLLPLFTWLPRYTEPGWFGISRPWLIGVPLLWIVIGFTCWKHRMADRIMPMLAVTSAIFVVAHISMLYSRAPHDTQAMVAHLGKLVALLAMLLQLMQMATSDMRDRIRAQQALAKLNEELEERIAVRTQQLQTSYSQVRAIVDTALDGLIVMDRAGMITEFNPAAEGIFGYQRAEVVGRSLADSIIPPAMRAKHTQGLHRYLTQGDAHVLGRRLELTGLRKDAAEIAVELSINEMPGEGAPLFAGFVRDITERKRAEALRAQHVAIVESSDDAIISKTLNGTITSWNRGAEKLFGYGAHEIIGQPASMLVPADRPGEEADILARLARGEGIEHFETERVHKHGRRIPVSVSISPLRDRQGLLIGAATIARDITDRRHAEHKLQMQLARLELLNQITRAIGERQDLASIFQVVVRTLEDELPIDFGCVCSYDALASTLSVMCVGLRSVELATELGMSEHATMPIDQNGLSRCVSGRLVYEPDIANVAFPFPQKLARGGLGAFVAAPLLLESKVFGVLIVARRATSSFTSGECEFLRQLSEHAALAAHQAETYAALQRAYEDLRQTQQAVMQQERLRALGQMASGIAHDINNAISPVALYTDSLLEREPALSVEGRAQLQIIQRALDDVAHTVARMREFYRQHESQLTPSPVKVNRLVKQVADLTRARWFDMPQQRGVVIQLLTDLAPNEPMIAGQESELREALTNLVFNAVDAMVEGGTLTLRTGVSGSGSSVVIEVNDTGIGMDDETRRRCMEPFFTTKGERGTGLGLAMVYGVLQRHAAEIEIHSTLGRGTTVRLIFASYANAANHVEHPVPDVAPPAGLRLLVVDDDPLLLKSLRDALESDGHHVVTASGGQEGINAFARTLGAEESFNVVFTDLGMPYVDGRKVAEAIKRLSPSTPVILLTGWGQRLLAEGEAPPHIDRILSKPPKLRHLRDALAQCCAEAADPFDR